MGADGDRRPGARFKDGRLYVFREEEVMIVHGWPEPSAITKRDGTRGWRRFAPDFPLVRPYRPPRKGKAAPETTQLELPGLPPACRQLSPRRLRARAFAQFRFSLPKPVAARLEPIRGEQWPLLLLFSRAEAAVELAAASPALALAVALGHRTGDVGELLARRQRDILECLGFPGTKGAARTLAKVEPASVSAQSLARLREVLACPDATKPLSHLRRIPAGALALVADPRLRAATTPALLAEVAADRRERHWPFTAEMLQDVLTMQADLPGRSGPGTIRSLDRLRRLHDELATEWCRYFPGRLESFRFPQPPVPGTRTIVPLRSPRELAEEGTRQHNCVAMYAQRVQARRCYIYRVLAPERATLSILPGPGRTWERGELLAAGNGPVRRETARAVDAWLEGHFP